MTEITLEVEIKLHATRASVWVSADALDEMEVEPRQSMRLTKTDPVLQHPCVIYESLWNCVSRLCRVISSPCCAEVLGYMLIIHLAGSEGSERQVRTVQQAHEMKLVLANVGPSRWIGEVRS